MWKKNSPSSHLYFKVEKKTTITFKTILVEISNMQYSKSMLLFVLFFLNKKHF